jgi:ionotropic glutamate receptor
MMTSGFVWIASDLMIGTFSLSMVDVSIMTTLQGVVGIRGYYAQESPEFKAFSYEWNNQTSSKDAPLIYGLYAYDAVWMLAYAIDSYIKDGYNITFENSTFPALAPGGSIDLARLRAFQGGPSLRNLILQTQFAGTSGYIQLNPRGDLISSAFEIVNIVAGEINVVGYWINGTGISSSPPGNSTSATKSGGSLSSALPILWPGNSKEAPRGWVLPKNGRPLYIAVPWKKGFDQFLGWSKSNSTSPVEFRGFVIDVFMEALKYVPYSVPYSFELFGNGTEPVYDDMIELLAKKVWDPN